LLDDVRFEVLMFVNMKIVYWGCNCIVWWKLSAFQRNLLPPYAGHPEHGDRRFLQNVGN
jgi:hypothetical protein